MKHHPVFVEMKSSQCGSDNQINLAFSLYIRLCEDKCLHFVDWHSAEELNTIIIQAKEEAEDVSHFYVPICQGSKITPQKIRKIIDFINSNWKDVVVVISLDEGDHKFIYYNVTNGCMNPESTEVLAERKERNNAKRKLRQYMNYHKEELLQSVQESTSTENDTLVQYSKFVENSLSNHKKRRTPDSDCFLDKEPLEL